jgi:alkylation response protein AidB-like acyl-CoA dehydrogenase
MRTKALYLPKMVSGEWTGTMNLTESQAGSDLSAVRTRAVPEADHYRIFGQKIFITWGEHNMTENTIHLVLARTPDAPEGRQGHLAVHRPQVSGQPGRLAGRPQRRSRRVLEHKLGIHASPTCVMAFGDQERRGRLSGRRGKQGLGLYVHHDERGPFQGRLARAGHRRTRLSGRPRVRQGAGAGPPARAKSGDRVAIIHHPDVRRMLMTMKSQNEAMRALAYVMAGIMDLARHHPDPAELRKRHQARVDLLIPVVKGWCTEIGIEIASLGVQVHGGMGFIEETGACQHLRDARITTIYEGTTGIQAADLVGRKLRMDQGRGDALPDRRHGSAC